MKKPWYWIFSAKSVSPFAKGPNCWASCYRAFLALLSRRKAIADYEVEIHGVSGVFANIKLTWLNEGIVKITKGAFHEPANAEWI